jgi:Caspase domain
MSDDQSSRTLAIVLGASVFPDSPKLQGASFSNSAADVRRYLVDEKGLGLPGENLLSLFNDSRSPAGQLIAIAKFLTLRSAQLKSEGSRPDNLLVYYVGHGSFTRGTEQAYCLAVRYTNAINEGATSIKAAELATVIKENTACWRRYLIFDCCFSASILKEFQGAALDAATVQLEREFPEQGTSLLCASNSYEPARAPVGATRTMFSDALIKALRTGHHNAGPLLSFGELGALVRENLRIAYPDSFVRPELHSPDQRKGDVATLPLFPNPAYRSPARAPESPRNVQAAPRPIAAMRVEEKPSREINKPNRDLEQRKRIEVSEVRASAPALENRRPVAKTPDPRPIDTVREKEKAARDLQDRKRKEEVEREERRAAQEAAAERVLEEGRRRRAAEVERKRIAAQKAQGRDRQLAATPKIESAPEIQPTQSAETGGSIAGGIAICAVAISIANLIGFFVGKFLANTLNGDFVHSLPPGLRDSAILVPVGGGLSYGVGSLLGKAIKAADATAWRFSAYLIWPGFLIGFCFINGLPSAAEPSIWLAIVMVVAFAYAVLSVGPEASSESSINATYKVTK